MTERVLATDAALEFIAFLKRNTVHSCFTNREAAVMVRRRCAIRTAN